MNYKTKTQIARIRNQWSKIKKVAKKEFGDFEKTEVLDRFAEYLLSRFGMEHLGSGYYKTAYSKDSCDFVVKVHWQGLRDDSGWSKARFAKYYLKPWFRNQWISIQPKATFTPELGQEAYEFFVEKYGAGYLYNWDVHEANVGYRNGKPVIFDVESFGLTA